MQESDPWACGVVLFAPLFGRYPFDHADNNYIRRLASAVYTMPAGIPISQRCKGLLGGLLRAGPANRMCMADVLDHPQFLQDLPDGTLEMNIPFTGASIHCLNRLVGLWLWRAAVLCCFVLQLCSATLCYAVVCTHNCAVLWSSVHTVCPLG